MMLFLAFLIGLFAGAVIAGLITYRVVDRKWQARRAAWHWLHRSPHDRTVAEEIDLTVFPPEEEDIEALADDSGDLMGQEPRVIETEPGVDKYEVPKGRPVVYTPPPGYHDVPGA